MYLSPRTGIRAAIGVTGLKNGSDNVCLLALLNKEVDEARSGNIAAVDERVIGQGRDELSRKIAGRHAGAFGQHHGDVAGKIAMTGIPWAVNLRRHVRCRI